MKDYEKLGQEPSSPTPYYEGHELYCDNQGLTKREIFAMHFASSYLNGQLSWTNGVDGGATPNFEEVAQEAVSYADALLKELSNG